MTEYRELTHEERYSIPRGAEYYNRFYREWRPSKMEGHTCDGALQYRVPVIPVAVYPVRGIQDLPLDKTELRGTLVLDGVTWDFSAVPAEVGR